VIGVIGLGFVGLTTALGFASKGYTVYGLDADVQKGDTIRSGKVPFYEPHLQDVLAERQGKNFLVVDSLKDLVSNCQAIFFCVGTPTGEEGEANLRALEQAITDTIAHVRRGEPRYFVIKSTVPPSTASDVVRPLIEGLGFQVGRDIGLASNPEFLREGCAWEDFVNPDRIVIGEHDSASGGICG
jgi:UDPglucose 6-dehydrogenase